jgi:2-oxoglutarate ferredoxin oxidoreductase subunit delta
MSTQGRAHVAKGRIEVSIDLCKGCTLCTNVCPKDLIHLSLGQLTPSGYHPAQLIDPNSDCTGCAICAVICPDAAISVYRWIREN